MSLVVLNSEAIDSCIRSMAASICAREGDMPIAIVGIRRGGEHLAQRLAREVEKVSGTLPPLGMVDITLYRDDGFGRSEFPEVGVTDLPFDIKTHTVILIDDVLYTGRTVRAAMDAVLDYGRPKAIRLRCSSTVDCTSYRFGPISSGTSFRPTLLTISTFSLWRRGPRLTRSYRM